MALRRSNPRPLPAADNSNRVLVAAARKVDLTSKEQVKRETKVAKWQTRAWNCLDVGEIRFAVNYFSNLISKLRLYAAVQIGDEHDATHTPLSVLLDARANPADATDDLKDLIAELDADAFDWDMADAAVEEMRRFRSVYGGQSELLRRMGGILEVAGECWIIGMLVDNGYGDVETWEVLSNKQVGTKQHDPAGGLWWFQSPDDREGKKIEEGTAWKVWIPAFDYFTQPDSLMRGILDDAESLGILTSQVKAEARSRHHSGLLLLPNELSFGAPDPTAGDQGPEATEDEFLDALEDALLAPVLDPDDAGTVMPTVIRGPSDVLKEIRHIDLSHAADEQLEARIQARVVRCARGLNMPVEVILGHQQTTFANAEQVDEDTYTKHVEPRAQLVVQALTYGYLMPQLMSTGRVGDDGTITPAFEPMQGRSRIVVWFDPDALIKTADPEANASDAFEKYAISAKAYRTAKGFTDDDAPDQAELVMRILLDNRNQLDVSIVEALLNAVLPEVPVDVERPDPPPAIGPGDQTDQQDQPQEDAAATQQAMISAAVAEAFRTIALPPAPPPFATAPSGAPLGQVLLGLDRVLRAQVHAVVEEASLKTLERAGIRAKNASHATRAIAAALTCPLEAMPAEISTALVAAGGNPLAADDLIPDDSFDHLEARIKGWIDDTGSSALDVVEEATSGFAPTERTAYQFRHLTDRDEAWEWMRSALVTNAKGKLFDDDQAGLDRAMAQIGETFDGVVPPGIIREAIARAGGNRVETNGDATFVVAGGKPPAGIATGTTTMDAAGSKGLRVDAYRWDYGGAPRKHPFEQHKNLHGRIFADFNDRALLKPVGVTFPPFSHFFPGDHVGCICDAEPILIARNDAAVAVTPAVGWTDEQVAALVPGKKHQWTNAAHDAANKAVDPDAVRALLRYQTAAHVDTGAVARFEDIERFRAAVARRVAGGKVGSAQTGREVDGVLRLLNGTPDGITPKVMRGVRLEGTPAELAARYSKGSTVDLNLSSFTDKRAVAERFAGYQVDPKLMKGRTSVVFEVDPAGAKAIPMHNLGANLGENEWITGGRFEVTGVKVTDGRVVVKVRQVHVLGADV